MSFYNPFLSARIVTESGESYALWTDPKGNFSRSGLKNTKSLPFLQDLTVEMQLAYLPVIKATLVPPYREGIDFLNSRLIEWGQSRLEVQFGYLDGGKPVLSPVLSGIILQPDVQIGSDISITLNAQGVGGFSAVRQQGTLTLNNTTRIEVIKKLFENRKLTLDDSRVTADRAAPEYQRLYVDKINFVQGGDTAWMAAWKILREARCYNLIIGNELRIIPQKLAFSGTPERTFRVMDYPGNFGALSQTLPILSASSPTMAVYLPGSARGYLVSDVGEVDKKVIKKLIGEPQVAPPRTGQGAAALKGADTLPDVDENGNNAETYPGDPQDERLISQVEAEYAAQASNMGVKLNIESIGDPTLVPGTVINVAGLGARLDRNYAVLKVTHKIGQGYSMSLETVSNVSQALTNALNAQGPYSPEQLKAARDIVDPTKWTPGRHLIGPGII